MLAALARLVVLLSLTLGSVGLVLAEGEPVRVLEVRGAITPTIVGYLDRGISQAERAGAPLVIIRLDTPGGLDDATRKIMQRIIASRIPIVVYVSPSGGRAASAGMFITQAAHVAAMAPDTNIGSAHPVQLGASGSAPAPDRTMTEKIENDAVAIVRSIAQTRGRNAAWVESAVRQSVNVAAREALELRVVDIVANDDAALLEQLDGRAVVLGSGETIILRTLGRSLDATEMTLAERIIQAIADPNIAYLLLTVGMYGLLYELANPGAWVPGVAGSVALLVAFYALGMLPVNWAGVALIGLAFALFLADVLVASSHGGLTAAGVLTLLLGSLFLFSGEAAGLAVSPWVILVVVGSSAAFFALVVGAVYRSTRRRATTGREGLVGAAARAEGELAPRGYVAVLGEHWRAELAEGSRPIAPGESVEVVAVNGLTLRVRPASEER